MKHAGPTALDALEPLLGQLRGLKGLREKSRGIFYVKSRPFLHFHEDPGGLFADIRPPGQGEFERLRADGPQGAEKVLEAARAALLDGRQSY